jgi:hypothetical protein
MASVLAGWPTSVFTNSAPLAERVGHRLTGGLVELGDDHVGALCVQGPGVGLANATSGAGDDGGAVGESLLNCHRAPFSPGHLTGDRRHYMIGHVSTTGVQDVKGPAVDLPTLPRRRLSKQRSLTVDRLTAAAVDELHAVGYAALTVRTVAARSGVAPRHGLQLLLLQRAPDRRGVLAPHQRAEGGGGGPARCGGSAGDRGAGRLCAGRVQ